MSRATAQVGDRRSWACDADPAALIGSISVDQPLDTVLIKITRSGLDPVEAQQLADAWVTALAKQVATIEDPRQQGPAGHPEDRPGRVGGAAVGPDLAADQAQPR